MRGIIRASLQFRLLVIAVAAGMMLFGITQLRNMPVDVLPEFAPPLVEIQTEALGLSAEEVEQMITVPLEQDLLNGVAWLDDIHSNSVSGLSSIVLTFEPGTDLIRARQMVTERLTQAHALPHVSKPPTMLQPLSSSNRVMMVGLSSKELSLIQMSVLARWTIGPRLLGVPGVANVAIWGQRDQQLQVQVDPQRLQEHGVSLQQVIDTTGNALWVSSLSFLEASTPGTGGFIDTPQQRLGIRHISPIRTADGLAQVPIEETQGKTLRLGDVANVVEDHQPLIGDAIGNDGASLLLVVEKFPGSNTLDVTRGVDEALAALRPGLTGIEMDSTIFRPATFIEMAISNLSLALLIGLLLVALVLGLFLFNWRTALISLIAIPVSLMAAVLVLYLRGESINTIVLAGLVIALAVVIDDAIVDVENIARRLRQARAEGSDTSTAAIILEAATETRSAIIYATLIVVLATVPIFFIGELSGDFFQPLAVSYVLAVLASMLVALTLTPALCLLLLGNAPRAPRASPLVGWLQQRYERLLAPIIRRPRAVYAIVGVAVVAGLAVVPLLQQSLVPSFKEPDLLIQMDGAPGTSRPEMNRIVAQASQELRSIPGVRNVGAHVGRAVLSDQVVGINAGELWVNIDPTADYGATVAAVQQTVNGYPGLNHEVQTYLKDRSNGVVAAPDDSVVVRVYGENPDTLRSTAADVQQAVARIDGVIAPQVQLPVEEPTLEIEVDLAAAQRYGLKPGDVRRAAATLLSGIQVGNLFEDQKVFDVVVWGVPEIRHSLTSVRDLQIDTPGGEQVRLADVAAVRVAPAPNVIRHEGVFSFLDINAPVQGRSLDAVAQDVRQQLQSVPFPLEYHAEVLGGYAQRQAAQTRLFSFAVAALLGIFLLLQAAFGSWRLATLAFITLPAALVGGMLAALASGGVISLGSLVGFLALFGIAARNGIMLLHHYQHLERREGETFGPELVLRGARERLTPIMMTAFATGLALLPFAVLGSIAGLEIVYPMALVMLGGLISVTLFNLFVMPALYLRFGASAAVDTLSEQLAYQPSFGFAYAGPQPGMGVAHDQATDETLKDRAVGE